MFSFIHIMQNLYPSFEFAASNSPKLHCFEITHTKHYLVQSSQCLMALYIRQPRLDEERTGRDMPSVFGLRTYKPRILKITIFKSMDLVVFPPSIWYGTTIDMVVYLPLIWLCDAMDMVVCRHGHGSVPAMNMVVSQPWIWLCSLHK